MAIRREAWFGSYLFVGLAPNGLAPILLPLASNGGAESGLSYASFALTGLAAPVLGTWADRTGRHRDLLIWGTIGAGLLLLPFDWASEPLRLLRAAGAGLGVMATTTPGNVLAIQDEPDDRWDARVALLQRYISAGQ